MSAHLCFTFGALRMEHVHPHGNPFFNRNYHVSGSMDAVGVVSGLKLNPIACFQIANDVLGPDEDVVQILPHTKDVLA
mgnify:CR=1 FL=1